MRDPEAEIGKYVKKFRKARGMTLKEISEKTGFSHGYLSKVENSKKAPPISTLLKLAKALDVGINALLGEEQEQTQMSLVRCNERKQLARDATRFGYSYEMLAPNFLNKAIDPYILTVPAELEEQVFFQHEGQEMMFVLEGKAIWIHGKTEFLVEEGDCLYFDASVPHGGKAIGGKGAKVLIAIWSP